MSLRIAVTVSLLLLSFRLFAQETMPQISFAESVEAGLRGGLIDSSPDTDSMISRVALDKLISSNPNEMHIANVAFHQAQSILSVSTTLQRMDAVLINFKYVQRTDYGSGMRTSTIYLRPAQMQAEYFDVMTSAWDRARGRSPAAIGSGLANTRGPAPNQMFATLDPEQYRNGIYAIQVKATAAELGSLVKSLGGTLYILKNETLQPIHLHRITQLERARLSYRNTTSSSSNQRVCPDLQLRRTASGYEPTITFFPCPDPNPNPGPPATTTVVSRNELASTYADYAQDPSAPTNPPPQRVSSLQRVLKCGIDPATGQLFQFIPDYSGTLETEANCPADVTWAPDDRFSLGAENDVEGSILITRFLSASGQVTREEMDGVIRTKIKWGSYKTFIPTIPNVAYSGRLSPSRAFDGDLPSGPGYFLNINTAAFSSVRPRCNVELTISGFAAQCSVGGVRQSQVIGLNERPSYEDEVVFPNDACTRVAGIPVGNSPCAVVLSTDNNLPCPYDDTGFLDDGFVPTVGSACANAITPGMLYENQVDFEIVNGADESHLTRATVHSGQIGYSATAGGGRGFSVFAIDTRKLEEKLAISVP